MERHVFLNLEALMRQRGWLEDSRYLRVDEQLAMFISIVGHNDRYRDIAEHFQRSLNTIGEHFKKVLRAFILLGQENIKPPNFSRCPKQILEKPKLYPFFKDCIGAIDGTHVSASVPLSKQIPYRGRKGDTTWNVMCACDLDMKFTFVYAGWEGSANDCRVFNEALNNPKFEFPHPPPGKYYVVDSGYPSTTGFLTPFKGQRYHLNDYRNRRPRTAVELFNNRHSSVRNVIERSFGSLKKRFPILSKMPCFSLNTQTCIVIAYCALHNFIREEEIADKNFKEFGENWWNEEPKEIQDYVFILNGFYVEIKTQHEDLIQTLRLTSRMVFILNGFYVEIKTQHEDLIQTLRLTSRMIPYEPHISLCETAEAGICTFGVMLS
ncbi:protein ALP1-like [Macadamia integrifolia]|uniref:protein ALP1-like n=1 Tax=Macadamia integrifolia TaxID=60698 RepID=UPI001C4FD990|nr:protein ALP1-like [Macadamia integrifolia]